MYTVHVSCRSTCKCRSHDDDRAYNPPGINMYWTYYMWVVIPTSPIQAICTCHVHVLYIVPQIFLVRQKFSSPRGVFRVIMMMMDGSGDKLDNVPICRPRAGGCTTYVDVYVHVPICIVCVTMCERTLPSCSRASPCGQERGRDREGHHA